MYAIGDILESGVLTAQEDAIVVTQATAAGAPTLA